MQKKKAIILIPNLNLFTPQAKARWDRIGKENQARILVNVWCGNCRRSVHIVVDSGKLENKFLILRGRCNNCNGPVVRVIEPED